MENNTSQSVAQQWITHHQNHRNKSLALANLLSISENSAYKRLYGITPFTLEEALKIANFLDMGMNELLYHDNPLFSANFSGIVTKSTFDYLYLIDKELDYILRHKERYVWAITNEIPDAYYYFFPELAMFKYYTWEKLTWENKEYLKKKFDFDISIDSKVVRKMNSMLHKYMKIPTIEIWNYNIFDNVLWQIEYFWKNGDFKNIDVPLRLCSRLNDLMNHIENMVIHGERFMPGKKPRKSNSSFGLYLNEAMESHNILMIRTNDKYTAYPVLDNPNFIKTTDKKVTNYIEELITVLKKQALPLSNVTIKYRRAFFNRINKKVEELKAKIK